MTVQIQFDRATPHYDKSRQQLFPCFDDFYGTAVELLDFPDDATPQVLDLGAGTGILASHLLQRYPRACLILADLSSNMLDKARERFGAKSESIIFRLVNYAAEPLGGPYDAVISALSIHHLVAEQKRLLFHKVFDALRPGSCFINADQVLGPTAAIERRYREMWLRQVRARGVDDSTLEAALERMKEDRMSTLDEQLGWLREAGFEDAACWYQHYSFVVYAGRKPNIAPGAPAGA